MKAGNGQHFEQGYNAQAAVDVEGSILIPGGYVTNHGNDKTEEGKEIYGKRKETVEPVFGIIKQTIGFRQFLPRGFEKVNTEWKPVTLAYDFKKLHRLTYGISLPKCPVMA
jgi:hypothetical protein